MKTVYLKLLAEDGSASDVEAVPDTGYVCVNPANGKPMLCHEVKAQGILSADRSVIYQLAGEEPIPDAVATAKIITRAEYDELLATLGTEEDPELTDAEALNIILGGTL